MNSRCAEDRSLPRQICRIARNSDRLDASFRASKRLPGTGVKGTAHNNLG
jgi:hypothetical protein